MHDRGKTRITQYWDLNFHPVTRTLKDAEEELLELLEESVRVHMIADVPVGFLLSGGVDSTAMLQMAMGKTAHSLSSYTLGFSAEGVPDERPYARLAAERYGSEHHDMTISSREFAEFLAKLRLVHGGTVLRTAGDCALLRHTVSQTVRKGADLR